MKKGLLKAGVLLLLFAAALGGTTLINREKIIGNETDGGCKVFRFCIWKLQIQR